MHVMCVMCLPFRSQFDVLVENLEVSLGHSAHTNLSVVEYYSRYMKKNISGGARQAICTCMLARYNKVSGMLVLTSG